MIFAGRGRPVSLTREIAAAAAFAELIIKEADNNVKLIVLDRFNNLRSKHEHVLDAMVMDILKVLSRSASLTSGIWSSDG